MTIITKLGKFVLTNREFFYYKRHDELKWVQIIENKHLGNFRTPQIESMSCMSTNCFSLLIRLKRDLFGTNLWPL